MILSYFLFYRVNEDISKVTQDSEGSSLYEILMDLQLNSEAYNQHRQVFLYWEIKRRNDTVPRHFLSKNNTHKNFNLEKFRN